MTIWLLMHLITVSLILHNGKTSHDALSNESTFLTSTRKANKPEWEKTFYNFAIVLLGHSSCR